MTALGEPGAAGTGGEGTHGGVTGQRPVAVYSCSRLGRVANPPGFSLPAWLSAGRRR